MPVEAELNGLIRRNDIQPFSPVPFVIVWTADEPAKSAFRQKAHVRVIQLASSRRIAPEYGDVQVGVISHTGAVAHAEEVDCFSRYKCEFCVWA